MSLGPRRELYYVLHMRRAALQLLLSALLVTALGCGASGDPESPGARESAPNEPPPGTRRVPDAQLVILTDLQGTLEPCGCAAGMLGGVDRVAQVVGERRAVAPTLFVAAGDLLFGPESAEAADETVARMETAALARVLGEDGAGLAASAPGAHDAAHAERYLQLMAETGVAPLALGWRGHEGATPPVGSLVRELGGRQIALVGVAELAGAVEGDLVGLTGAEVARLRGEGADFVVVLYAGPRRLARRIARTEGIDLLVLGGQDRSEVLSPETDETLIVHAGRQGEGVVTLGLYWPAEGAGPWTDHSEWTLQLERERLDAEIETLATRLAAWEQEDGRDPATLAPISERLAGLRTERAALPASPAPIAPGEGAFTLGYTPLPRERAQDPAARQVLEAFDVEVNDHNRQAFAEIAPPPAADGGASYVGSRACASCHAEAYTWWSAHPHGHAYATLASRNKQFHLECVGCHVTGYQRPGGANVTHLLDGALENVGCENCHGPGSRHVADPSVDLVAEPPERTCVGCHNEEHSPRFVYEAYRRTLLVPGHGLPAEGDPAAPAGMDLTTMEAQP